MLACGLDPVTMPDPISLGCTLAPTAQWDHLREDGLGWVLALAKVVTLILTEQSILMGY